MSVIALVEDNDREGRAMADWIEREVADVTVWRFLNTRDVEEKLKLHGKQVSCIVLDMFFPSNVGGGYEASGLYILERYSEIPTVLISGRPGTRRDVPKKYAPLLQLDKPENLFSDRPQKAQQADEFRRDLVEAVNCAIHVSILRRDIAMFRKSRPWLPFIQKRTFMAALLLIAMLVFWALSTRYSEFVQHLGLTLVAVTAVHLLDRTILLVDFQDAFESVGRRLDEVSIQVQHLAQNRRWAARTELTDAGSIESDQLPEVDDTAGGGTAE